MQAGAITVSTYNIHGAIGTDGRFAPLRIASVLQEIDADVVALQEVEHHDVDGRDLLDYLADKTAMTAIAGPTLLRETRDYGNAVLTRLPVLAVERVDLSLPGREPRGALNLMLDWKGQRLQVVATHLGLKPAERRQQVLRLLELFDSASSEASLLLGDLNEWLLWGRPLRLLHRHFAANPPLRTFPARRPLFALDRIWVYPHAALQALIVHRSALAAEASDHLPLKAVLAKVD
jgi:endonuclease/exonuclease/phosphatase family metal-dependent hydrolase